MRFDWEKRVLAVLRRIGTDRIAMTLSGLCLIHCAAGVVLVSLFAIIGGALVNPIVHEVGLGLAIPLAVYALGRGYAIHKTTLPLMIGGAGVCLMAGGISVPHGDYREVALTVTGVSLVAVAHYFNRRALA